MNCPYCGTPLPDNAQFCHECGTRIEAIPQQPYVPGSDYNGAPNPNANVSPQPKKRTGLIIGIVVAVFVLLIATAITVTTCSLMNVARNASNETPSTQTRIQSQPSESGMHPVVFIVSITDYGTGSSRIPVHITGTDDDGNDIDKNIYLAYSGADVELPNGTYHAEVVGSPISSDGTIYEIPTTVVDFTLGSDLDKGETYKLPNSTAFTFTPIDPMSLTDEQVEDALTWARRDEESQVDVDALEKAIQESRTEASA